MPGMPGVPGMGGGPGRAKKQPKKAKGKQRSGNPMKRRAEEQAATQRRTTAQGGAFGLPGAGQVRIPLDTSVAPTGTLRLILRGGRVEIHYRIDASLMRSTARPHGTAKIGVDKGYTEVLVDSEREHHGTGRSRGAVRGRSRGASRLGQSRRFCRGGTGRIGAGRGGVGRGGGRTVCVCCLGC